MTERNPVRDAVRYALTAGVAASFVGAPAASFAEDDVAVQEKVTVTGSRIKRVDIEGPSPVAVISRDDIDATGDISVAEVLRGSVWNSFGSFKQRSGSSAQSQSTVSLRGLGPTRTLVLIDGRRMAGSPTFGAGSAQNLNVIPLAAVERIEVLRDGASAVYGSDAIGGVVNIILRKDYEGMNLAWGIGRPTQTGGDEDSYSVVGGLSSGKGNITFGFDVEKKEIIFQGDRSYSAVGLSSFGFPGSYFGYLTTNDPRNPTGEFLSVGTSPDPRCPTELNGPDYPASQLVGTRCRYNYAGVAANEAESDTKTFFVNVNYDLNETTQFFARGNFAFNESFGRYAPSPFTSPLPTLSQNNPNNPTIPGATNIDGQPFGGQSVTLEDGTVVEGPFDLSLFYRNVPGGFRDTNIDDTLIDYMVGVNGTVDFLGGMDWELAGQWSQQTSNSASPGLGIIPFLQRDIDSGDLDIFAVNSDTDATFQQSASFDGIYDARTRIASIDGNVGWDLFQMPAGPVPIVLGAEYRDEDFRQNYDAQSNAGSVAGSSGGQDNSGARVVKSIFTEMNIPIFSMLDATVALRYDDYNDFGTTLTPQAKLAFRPLDSLLLRASYGEGFRAPSMTQLYSGQSQSFDGAVDTYRCSLDPADTDGDGAPNVDPGTLPPGNPCRLTQYQNLTGGNPKLDAETSTQWGAGVVWNPLDDLTVALDYYNIELEDEIGVAPLQSLFDQEFRARQAGQTGNTVGAVTRIPGNQFVDFVANNNTNIAKTETDGLELDASYLFSAGAAGDFRTQLLWTHVLEYERDNGDGLGKRRLEGTFDPENRASFNLGWSLGDFSANATWNYMDEAENADDDSPVYAKVDDYSTVDLSFGYATPWNGQITVGARNIFDEDPPTSTNIGSPFYTNYLHDVYGRVPYVRYEQDL
jgi:iron complex outermembrane receptor protein